MRNDSEVEVQVHQRHHQWRGLVRIGPVDVRTRGQQFARAGDAAFARGIQQRREATAVHALGARLGSHAPLPLADRTAGAHIGAGLDQHLDHLGLALRGGPHQRRLPTPLLLGVHLGAGLQQQLRRIDLAGASHHHQCGLPFRIRRFHIRACAQQQPNHLRATRGGRLGQRHGAEIIARIRIGLRLQQRLHQAHIGEMRGVVQRRGAIRLARARIGTLLQRIQRGFRILRLQRGEQLGIGIPLPGRPGHHRRQQRQPQEFAHVAQISAKVPVLSPIFSTGTPARSSRVSSRFACGVFCGYFRCCPPLIFP